MSNWSPDVVYDTSPSGMGSYEGQATVRTFMQDLADVVVSVTVYTTDIDAARAAAERLAEERG